MAVIPKTGVIKGSLSTESPSLELLKYTQFDAFLTLRMAACGEILQSSMATKVSWFTAFSPALMNALNKLVWLDVKGHTGGL